MKTLQIEAGGGWDQTPTNNELLAAIGINAPQLLDQWHRLLKAAVEQIETSGQLPTK